MHAIKNSGRQNVKNLLIPAKLMTSKELQIKCWEWRKSVFCFIFNERTSWRGKYVR